MWADFLVRTCLNSLILALYQRERGFGEWFSSVTSTSRELATG